MKILFSPCHYVYDESSGGSEPSWAYNIAHRVASLHHQSVVVTGYKNVLTDKTYRVVELQSYKRTIDLSIGNALKYNLLYSVETLKELKRSHFDILHHVLPFGVRSTFNISLILGKLFRTRTVIGPIQSPLRYRDVDVDLSDVRNFSVKSKMFHVGDFVQLIFSWVTTRLSAVTLRHADNVVVITEHTRRLLLAEGVMDDKISIIYPGIDSNYFGFVDFQDKSDEVFELITVGYLIKRKGIELIIQSVAKAREAHKGIRLRIVGDGPQMEALRQEATDCGISDYVIFQGFVPNSVVQDYYGKAHAFVSMSRAESWGQMYLEAMACGLPVLSSRNVGANEIVKDEECGLLINQGDVDDLSKKIIFLANHRDIAAAYGRKARQEVEEKYDWEKIIIPQYLKLYKSLLS